jgi:hypothetical protein
MVAKGRRPLLAVLALSVLGALVLALPASAAPLAYLETDMSGKQEVPGPGDPDGRGHADLKVFSAKVCYTLSVKFIEPATGAHIHKGPRGVAGPVVVPLEPPTDGSSSGCVDVSQRLAKNLREYPQAYYINVHNQPFPGGAIRGQLERD